MSLPPAVQRQVDKAHELSKGAPGGDTPPKPPANTDQTAGAYEKSVADLAAANAEVTRLTQANRVLQGKYDAEVPRLAEDIRKLKAEKTDLEGQIARANIKPGQLNSLSEDERTMAGPMLGISEKVAREVVTGAVEEATRPLREQIDVLQRQGEAAFMATLNAHLPVGWDDPGGINNDPKFLAWLNGNDPATGRTRFDVLKRAEAAKQGFQVVEVFNAYQEGREIGARAPAKPKPSKTESHDPPPGGGGGDPDLTQDGGKKKWTRAEIAAFYTNKRTDPQYQGADGKAKARAIEEDIAAAQREGRVTG